MIDRQKVIEFERNYCQHYGRAENTAGMCCKKGHDLNKVQVVRTGNKSIQWGPCIEGHFLKDPTSYCPDWIRRTVEQGEARADEAEKAGLIFSKVLPFVNKWRSKSPKGKEEVVVCPVCQGKLHLFQSSYNGHVHARCETKDCVSFME